MTDPGKQACDFIRLLTHSKGKHAREKFQLRGWQEEIIQAIFGHLNEAGQRIVRTVFVLLPRKNGKTELMAAVCLYCLFVEQEIGGEIYACAADRDQASIIFSAAVSMIRHDAELSKCCKIRESQKRILYEPTRSVFRAVSSDAHTKHGYSPSVCVYDEVHAAPNPELWRVMETGMGARDQPLMIGITTAGFDRNSLEYELFEYASRVDQGIVEDPSFLPILYYAPDESDWTDEKVWHDANPALGDFRSLDEMRQSYKRAKEIPRLQNHFRRLYLNQHTEQDVRWIDMHVWDEVAGVDLPDLIGRECWCGLDVAIARDLSAFVMLFDRDEGGYWVKPVFWLAKEAAESQETRDRAPYAAWQQEGLIHLTPGRVTDLNLIRRDINELATSYQIREIQVDRLFQSHQLMQDLGEQDGFNVEPHGQGFISMAAPTEKTERRIVDRQLYHGGHKVLRWNMSNAVVDEDPAGNIKPDKAKSTSRIDGAVAMIMAMTSAMKRPLVHNHYNDSPLLVLGEDQGGYEDAYDFADDF